MNVFSSRVLEKDDKISFLNVILIKDNEKNHFWSIIINQHSPRDFFYLNIILITHKKSYRMMRVLVLLTKSSHQSHFRFQQENFMEAISILLKNGYPLEFIFFMINKKLNYIFYNNSRY